MARRNDWGCNIKAEGLRYCGTVEPGIKIRMLLAEQKVLTDTIDEVNDTLLAISNLADQVAIDPP